MPPVSRAYYSSFVPELKFQMARLLRKSGPGGYRDLGHHDEAARMNEEKQ